MQKMYPLMKLALGLNGTLTSSAGYASVQITTNGLTQAFEVSTGDSVGMKLIQILLTSLRSFTPCHESPKIVRRSRGWTRQCSCRR